MDERELEGVIAHEISHVRNRDVRLMTLVAVLVGVIALISDFLLRISLWGGGRKSSGTAGLIAFAIGLAALLLAPIAGVLIQLAVSRRREYLADASGGGDHRRRRGPGDGACASSSTTHRDGAREPRGRAPLHREPAEPGVGRRGDVPLAVRHPPAARGPDPPRSRKRAGSV